MITQKIIITGGPGTGKTSIITRLKEDGYFCFEEISRQITLDARKEGTEQLFLTDPILFSERLLEGRIKQYDEASKSPQNFVFLDRGIPDVLAYLKYSGTDYPIKFEQACNDYRYDKIFVLAPWQEIFESDNERYEDFDQAEQIHQYLLHTYEDFNYKLWDVPFGSVEKRTQFILNAINKG
ncbi:MAG: ATP-binding protein [Flavobacteriaceae bacterium]|nr:ATP-binding protein [Flavobacteriaceae bacterium]